MLIFLNFFWGFAFNLFFEQFLQFFNIVLCDIQRNSCALNKIVYLLFSRERFVLEIRCEGHLIELVILGRIAEIVLSCNLLLLRWRCLW